MYTTDGGVTSNCGQYLNIERLGDTEAEIQRHVGKSLFRGNAVFTKLFKVETVMHFPERTAHGENLEQQ